MASTRKGNEDDCNDGKLWQLVFLGLWESMMNTKTAIRSDFQDRYPQREDKILYKQLWRFRIQQLS